MAPESTPAPNAAPTPESGAASVPPASVSPASVSPASINPASVSPASVTPGDAVSRGTRITRWVLVAVGVALLAVGALVLMVDVSVSSYPGLLLWLAGSLVLHDGVLAVIVLLVSVVLRRSSRRIPFGVLLIVQGAVVVAAIASLLVVPEILKKGIGTQNPTVLPLDYGANLIGFYVALTVLTALAVVIYLKVTTTRKARLTVGHD